MEIVNANSASRAFRMVFYGMMSLCFSLFLVQGSVAQETVAINGNGTSASQGYDGVLCVLCSITGEDNLVDEDTTNYAVINLATSVLGRAYVRVKSATPFSAGDRAGFAVEAVGGLLDATVLGGVEITTYLDGVEQESSGDGTTLSLSLLPGSSEVQYVEFNPSADFDEIEFTYGGLASLLQSIRVYYAFTTAEDGGGNTVPGEVTLGSPTNGATDVSMNPTLSWQAASGATAYQVQVATSSSFASPVVDTDVTPTSVDATNLAENTTYYWRVRGRNSAGDGPWSDTFSFTTEESGGGGGTVPGEVVLEVPANNAMDVALDLTLSWQDAPGATSYQVQVSTGSDFSDLFVDATSVTATSLDVYNLEEEAQYYWRVRGRNSAGDGPWSDPFAFTTGDEGSSSTVPGEVTLEYPGDGATGISTSTTFSWQGASGATVYHVQVSTESNFSNPLIDEEDIAATSMKVEDLAENTTYYWRGRGRNNVGDGPWSDVFSFTTGDDNGSSTVPEEVVLEAPDNGAASVSLSPTLLWEPAQRATSYRIQIATMPHCTNPIMEIEAVTATSFELDGLDEGTTYYWRVSGHNDVGYGPWSETFSLTTGFTSVPGQAGSGNPENNASGVATNLVLSWDAMPRAASYHVQVSEQADFSSTFVDLANLNETSIAIGNLEPGVTYYWRIRARNNLGYGPWSSAFAFTTALSTASEIEGELPTEYRLEPNYPNPFNPSTQIRFAAPQTGPARIVVFDALGREVAVLLDEASLPAGTHTVTFNASSLPSGMYLYRLETSQQSFTKSMLLIK